jgi:hypothetical protein
MMDLLAIFGIDIGEEPVDVDISLDPPAERKAVARLHVDKASFRRRYSTGCLFDGVNVRLSLFSRGTISRHGKLKSAHGGLESLGGLDGISLPQCRWSFALVERVAEGEHLPIAANVDIEVRIVDVQSVDGLLEVEMSDAVVRNVVVID